MLIKLKALFYLGADYMGIFSPVDRAESPSQASYKILVKRSLRLHEENFSSLKTSARAEILHVISPLMHRAPMDTSH